jgi:hypothetical protein
MTNKIDHVARHQDNHPNMDVLYIILSAFPLFIMLSACIVGSILVRQRVRGT